MDTIVCFDGKYGHTFYSVCHTWWLHRFKKWKTFTFRQYRYKNCTTNSNDISTGIAKLRLPIVQDSMTQKHNGDWFNCFVHKKFHHWFIRCATKYSLHRLRIIFVLNIGAITSNFSKSLNCCSNMWNLVICFITYAPMHFLFFIFFFFFFFWGGGGGGGK